MKVYAAFRLTMLCALLVLGIGVFSATAPEPANAEGTFLSVPDRTDVVFDDSRRLLYISAGDRVLRYNPDTGTYLSPIVIGGSLAGMDISADGKTLAVADLTYTSPSTDAWVEGGALWIHAVALDTGVVTKVPFVRSRGEKGSWMVAFGDNGMCLVTSRLSGSGWNPLRGWNSKTGAIVTYQELRHDTALSASGDRSIIGFAEADSSDGPWGRYRVSDGSIVSREWYENGTSGFNYEISVNRNGTQYAIPVYEGLYIYDAAYQRRFTLPTSEGAEYSPTADVLFVPYRATGRITAYETSSYAQIDTYNFEAPYWAQSGVFDWVRMAIPRDNSLIAATVPGGVRIVRTRMLFDGAVTSAANGAPIEGATVEVFRENGSNWTLDRTLTSAVNGRWSFSTESTAGIRVRVTDPSGMHQSQFVGGGTDLATATTFASTPPGARTLDAPLPVVSLGSLGGTLKSARDGRLLPDIVVTLYRHDGTALRSIATTTTDATGRWHFQDLPAVKYRLQFTDPAVRFESGYYSSGTTVDKATPISLTGSAETVVSHSLQPVTYLAWGKVRSEFLSWRLDGMTVEFWSAAEIPEFLGSTVTAEQGSWGYAGDTSQPIKVKAVDPSGVYAPTWYGGETTATAATLQPVRYTGPTCLITSKLAAPAAISGRVRGSNRGQSLSGIKVVLNPLARPGSSLETITVADGSFRFDRLPVGDYLLSFRDLTGTFRSSYYKNTVDMASATAVTLAGSQTASVDDTMTLVPATICGVAKSTAQGYRVPFATVEIWRKVGAQWSMEGTVTADKDGAWSYPGEFTTAARVHVVDPSGIHADGWYGGPALPTAADVVPVRAGSVVADTTHLMMMPGVIRGVVRSALTGLPVPGVQVTCNRDGGALAGFTTTGPDGSFSVAGLGADTYSLGFEDPRGRYAELTLSTPAEKVAVTSPRPVDVNTAMTPLPGAAVVSFMNPRVAHGSSASPYVGQPVEIETAIQDVDTRTLLDGQRLVVQRSYDSENWETLEGLDVENTWLGTYTAVVTPASDAPVKYRFRLADDELGFAADSGSVQLTPHSGTSTWRPVVFQNTGTPVATSVAGAPLILIGRLTDYAGKPIDGATVKLQSSIDGKLFADTPGIVVENLVGGYYRVTVAPAGSKQYRFVSEKLGWDEGATSEVASVSVRGKLHQGMPRRVRAPRAASL